MQSWCDWDIHYVIHEVRDMNVECFVWLIVAIIANWTSIIQKFICLKHFSVDCILFQAYFMKRMHLMLLSNLVKI